MTGAELIVYKNRYFELYAQLWLWTNLQNHKLFQTFVNNIHNYAQIGIEVKIILHGTSENYTKIRSSILRQNYVR